MADDEIPSTVTTNVRTVEDVRQPTEEIGVLPEGTQIGRYVIKKVIGRGGMGVVYVAFDPSLSRRIAIKILNTNKAGTAMNETKSAQDRMLREAQAMAAIGHPNLVQVHDVGTYDGSVFIAMEFVNGRTLREWNAETNDDDWEEVIKVYKAAAEAVQAAHDAKLIHRDFKPDNVMLGFDNRVRVMDFGLARSTGKRKSSDSMTMSTSNILGKPLTATGVIMGTPAYMAPEQFLGEPTDARTDQFSFCVTLYEALYGYRPFQGKNMTEVAKAVMRGKIKLPPKKHPVPGYVLDTLLKGLQCTPDDRWDSMQELIEALEEPPKRDLYPPWVLYVVIAAVAVSGIGFYWYSAQMLETAKGLESGKDKPDEMKLYWQRQRKGILPRVKLDKVLLDNWHDVETCLNRRDDKETLNGTLTLKFILTETGSIDGYGVEKIGTVSAISNCLMMLSNDWKFPAPDGGEAKVFIRLDVEYGVVVNKPQSSEGSNSANSSDTDLGLSDSSG